MQRALVIMAVAVLVSVALLAGTLAANWPFWVRAWHWQMAADGWPENLPGPARVLHGGAALPLQLETQTRAGIRCGYRHPILLVAGADGRGSAFLAPGYTTTSVVDGRGLAAGLLAPLYGLLAARQPELLDMGIGTWIGGWRADQRGEVTPRQLLWQLGGFRPGISGR